MSLRQLMEPECGAPSTLVRFGEHATRDLAFKDEGLLMQSDSSSRLGADQFVNDFLGQIAPAPQTFRMDSLLQEMREIDAQHFHPPLQGPLVIDEVSKSATDWAKEFSSQSNHLQAQNPFPTLNEFWLQPMEVNPVNGTDNVIWVKEFFDVNETEKQIQDYKDDAVVQTASVADNINYNEFVNFMKNVDETPASLAQGQILNNKEENPQTISDTWLDDFQKSKEEQVKNSENYNNQFWNNLQEEWKKISEGNEAEHPWLTDFSDYYDPYKEYNFSEDNPLLEDAQALEKGKAFLVQGDIPSAVLCFESAARQDPQNADVWELLGVTQAENEMDPSAIAALRKSLELNPNNMKVLMALAVSYTNESLQSQALKMLTTWLHCNPRYKNLVPTHLLQFDEGTLTSSLIRGPELKEIQSLFLNAVKQNPTEIDPDIQEALGVLFNLSSEYDKAVDCFQAAVQARPDNAKTWNRLGASLANGNRSVEAVDAYQRSLEIQPGFIRARYNVGIICMNLKAYKEAAEHLLTALNLQATSSARSGLINASKNKTSMQESDTIWSTLKMVISLMGRRDLQEMLDRRDLNALNQHFNDS